MKQEEIIKLVTDWKDGIKDLVSSYEKAINKLDSSKKAFESAKTGLIENKTAKCIKVSKALVPFIPILFLAGLFFLSCGINFDGYGVKFSTSSCQKTAK